eukprot:scaffold247657_cov33-Prasinocladus_malaysianus.AAC.1
MGMAEVPTASSWHRWGCDKHGQQVQAKGWVSARKSARMLSTVSAVLSWPTRQCASGWSPSFSRSHDVRSADFETSRSGCSHLTHSGDSTMISETCFGSAICLVVACVRGQQEVIRTDVRGVVRVCGRTGGPLPSGWRRAPPAHVDLFLSTAGVLDGPGGQVPALCARLIPTGRGDVRARVVPAAFDCPRPGPRARLGANRRGLGGSGDSHSRRCQGRSVALREVGRGSKGPAVGSCCVLVTGLACQWVALLGRTTSRWLSVAAGVTVTK